MLDVTPVRFRREHLILCGVLALAAGLIFFRLTRADVQTDAGHYSLRAIGYLDFLDSPRQTTPLQWFKPAEPPKWTKLSFHDHPPVVFLLQHLAFRLFGVNDTVASLPFAVSGVLSVWLLYLIGRRLGGPGLGLAASGVLAVSTFFTWSSRIGYLEGVEQAFILLAVWLFLRALQNPAWLPLWGLGLGFSLMTKYSAVFQVPVFFLMILLYQRQWFADRRFWAALGLVVVVVSPVAYYNVQLWRTRGHLDVQLSTMLPSALPAARRDWPILFDGPRSRDLSNNARDLAVNIGHAFSRPFVALLALGICALAWRILRGSRQAADTLGAGALAALAAFFVAKGPSLRYLPIVVPWLALAAAGLAVHVWQVARQRTNVAYRAGVLIILALVGGRELSFNWNTNHALVPKGQRGRDFAAYRQEALGFQELERYLLPKLKANPNFSRIVAAPRVFDDWQKIHIQRGSDVILYDDGLTWFSAFWYLRRYRLYYQTTALLAPTDLEGMRLLDDWPSKFGQGGVRTVYFIAGNTPTVYDPWAAALGDRLPSRKFAAALERLITQGGAPGTITPIRTPSGQLAFTVYEMPLNP